jgi:hypothetical protein
VTQPRPKINRLSDHDPEIFEKMLSVYQSFTTVTASLNGGLDRWSADSNYSRSALPKTRLMLLLALLTKMVL